MNKRKSNWLLALLLTIPMMLFYGRYFFNHTSNIIPTGFIAYDNVSYAAYAKEYLDQDHFHFLYSNPLNDSANYPKIYFQTQNIFLAFLLTCGIPAGFALILFNFLCTVLSFRIVIAIYDHLVSDKKYRTLFISFFCWGGGLLALAGIPVAWSQSGSKLDFFDRIFFIDPAWGWWALNFGRAHFISCESYYHLLFLLAIFSILKRRWNLSLVVAFFLSVSHPFTGIEFLLIVTVWAGIEKLVLRNEWVPWKFFAGILFILCFHVFYYLFWLNRFPEHASVQEQYSLNWRLRYFHMIPAWCIVGALAFFSLIRFKTEFFKQETNRLFLCWFAVAFLLANHEVFMSPRQPIHFTRGYIWTSLFLLGLPALQMFFKQASEKRRWLIPVFIILMFSDNFLWITNYVRTTARSVSVSHISYEQRDILEILNKQSNNQTLVIGSDPVLPYLSTVYSSAYPWLAHPYTTPFVSKKREAYYKFISENIIDESWKGRDVIFIFRKNDPAEYARAQALDFPSQLLANTKTYVLLRGRP